MMSDTPKFGDQPEANVIYQAHQDAVSRALMTGAWDVITSRISLPYSVVTLDKTTLIETETEGESFFHTVANTLSQVGVTDIVRTVRSARYVSPDEIEGEHTTHLLNRGIYVLPPYKNRVTLRQQDGIWKETHSSSAFFAKTGPFTMPSVPETDDVACP